MLIHKQPSQCSRDKTGPDRRLKNRLRGLDTLPVLLADSIKSHHGICCCRVGHKPTCIGYGIALLETRRVSVTPFVSAVKSLRFHPAGKSDTVLQPPFGCCFSVMAPMAASRSARVNRFGSPVDAQRRKATGVDC